jgi:hypothetical protein
MIVIALRHHETGRRQSTSSQSGHSNNGVRALILPDHKPTIICILSNWEPGRAARQACINSPPLLSRVTNHAIKSAGRGVQRIDPAFLHSSSAS